MAVILITFDFLASSRIGPYGQYDGRTPAFDQLAARSAVFHQALCHRVPNASRTPFEDFRETCPLQLSPREIIRPLENEHPRDWVHRSIDAMRAVLAAPSPECLWISSPGVPDPWIPRHAGWEEAVAQKLRTNWNELLADEPDEMTPDRAVHELAAEGHFSRTHHPKTVDRNVDRLSLALYQTCVEKLDERLGRLLREYQRHAQPDSLLIVAGLLGDRLPFAWPVQRVVTLCSELVQVPLFVQPGLGWLAGEERESEGMTILDLAQTTDIWSTVAASLSGEVDRPGQLDLRDMALKKRPGRKKIEIVGPDGERLIRSSNAQLVIRQTESDLIHWLTVKPDDAWDLLNVSGQNAALVEELVSEHERTDA